MSKASIKNIVPILSTAFFLMILVEITASVLAYKPLVFAAHVALPVLLFSWYVAISVKRDAWMLAFLLLQIVSNAYFFFAMTNLYLYSLLSFLVLRVLSLILVFKHTPERSLLHLSLGSFPFLLVFFYLNSVTSDVTDTEFNILIVQSILIALLGGFSLVNYLKNDCKVHSLLLISTLLYIGLRLIVFIEHYFLSESPDLIYKTIEIVLSALAMYTFCIFVVTAEQNVDDKNERH